MSDLLLVTGALEPSVEVLPALGLLLHPVRVLPADASALVEAPPADVVLVDARRDLAHAKSICRLLHTTGLDCPMLAIVTEGGLAAMSAEWNVDDVILHTAGPAEVEARLRMATGRRAQQAAQDTPDEIRKLCAEDSRVRLLRRMERGLATAVIDGFNIARGDLLAVIDGDLQHPPEMLAHLLRAQRETRADVVVPSRYMPGGDPGGLSGVRRLLSLGGRALAHILLRESRVTSDPMSGCFLVTRAAAAPILRARPKGFKILLEVLAQGSWETAVEVPFSLEARAAGDSKAQVKVYVSRLPA